MPTSLLLWRTTLRVPPANTISALAPPLTNLTLTVVLIVGESPNNTAWATVPGQPVPTQVLRPLLRPPAHPSLAILIRTPVKPGPGLMEAEVRQQCNGASLNAMDICPILGRRTRRVLIPPTLALILWTSHLLGQNILV